MSSRILALASVLAATGYGIACSSSSSESNDAPDASNPNPYDTFNCDAGPTPPSLTVDADVACALYENAGDFVDGLPGGQCPTSCPPPFECSPDPTFTPKLERANNGWGPAVDGGKGPLLCPADAGPVTFTCARGVCKGGRRTAGFDVPLFDESTDVGARLASMARLEAVSVHAFARLARELEAHGAGASLLRRVRRAEADEARHARIVARLARERGAVVELPGAPRKRRVRSLVAIAIENAVEGCVRETYGALVGAIERETSPDASIRRAMKAVTLDDAATLISRGACMRGRCRT